MTNLHEILGTTRESFQAIWEDVEENHRKLDACPGHDFQKIAINSTTTKAFECKNCDGTVDAIAYLWYLKGLEHGEKK